jgi:hypothetical protein
MAGRRHRIASVIVERVEPQGDSPAEQGDSNVDVVREEVSS